MADAAIAGGGFGATSGWGVRLFRAIGESYAAEGERRLLWLPVFFGAGIGVYFSLTFEPPLWAGLVPPSPPAPARSRCTGARCCARPHWR